MTRKLPVVTLAAWEAVARERDYSVEIDMDSSTGR